jgi:hypothetical protein
MGFTLGLRLFHTLERSRWEVHLRFRMRSQYEFWASLEFSRAAAWHGAAACTSGRPEGSGRDCGQAGSTHPQHERIYCVLLDTEGRLVLNIMTAVSHVVQE